MARIKFIDINIVITLVVFMPLLFDKYHPQTTVAKSPLPVKNTAQVLICADTNILICILALIFPFGSDIFMKKIAITGMMNKEMKKLIHSKYIHGCDQEKPENIILKALPIFLGSNIKLNVAINRNITTKNATVHEKRFFFVIFLSGFKITLSFSI